MPVIHYYTVKHCTLTISSNCVIHNILIFFFPLYNSKYNTLSLSLSLQALGEPMYRVSTGNYEYRLILRCRQEARARFAKMRKDVLEKIELLDQKHGLCCSLSLICSCSHNHFVIY